MARTIVLVRHGKAEKARVGLADRNRELTEAGASALAEAFPRTFSLLASGATGAGESAPAGTGAWTIWTSPAVRARQTAQRVIEALGGNDIPTGAIELHESLWHQDDLAFLEELAETSEDARLIVVGHIPFMEGMLERLCGAAISFAPGGVACVSVAGDPSASAPGRLAWFMQGPQVLK